MKILEHLEKQTGYAKYLAEDGAFKMAAKVLHKLATDLEQHQERCIATMEMKV